MLDCEVGHRKVVDVGRGEVRTDANGCGRDQTVGLVKGDPAPCELADR
jgi:hypothetical protein